MRPLNVIRALSIKATKSFGMLFLVVVLVLYNIFLQASYNNCTDQHDKLRQDIEEHLDKFDLQDINQSSHETNVVLHNDEYMKSLQYVCVISNGIPQSQKIVVHNSRIDFLASTGHFPVEYSKGPIPQSYKYHPNTTAYFVATRFTLNFFHNIDDFLVPLFHLLSKTNGLNSNMTNVLYEKEMEIKSTQKIGKYKKCKTKICNIMEPFLKMFPFKSKPWRFDIAPSKVCYRYGIVFSQIIKTELHTVRDRTDKKSTARRALGEYLKKGLSISDSFNACPVKQKYGSQITIIQRKRTRKMANLMDVLKDVKKAGISNIEVVSMEMLSMRKQLEIIHCTDILVGVHGAGLTWAMFLRENTVLVEIAYPQLHKQVGFFFSKMVKQDPYISVLDYTVPKADILHINKAHLHWYRDVDVNIDALKFTKVLKNALRIVQQKQNTTLS